jgi:hypothetical protein
VKPKMKDFYGRTFNKEDIINRDSISFIKLKSLNEFTEAEISSSTVLITDKINGDKLYLLSELEQILHANYYCRLEDPFTRNDILAQIPDFKVVLEFEQQATHYNASILEKHPDFIPLLKTYVKESLNRKDERAFGDTDKNDIAANKSLELNQFYDTIANFPDDKKHDFFSLFITNRRPYNQEELWTFPAKWELDQSNLNEQIIYRCAINNNYFKLFPHQNVLVVDLITNPENACMHSWGMDVLHLLLNYHIGTNKPFTLFNFTKNPRAFEMEMELRSRIEQETKPGSLDSRKGRNAIEKVKDRVTNQLILKLELSCTNYMDYILLKLTVKKEKDYPLPEDLTKNDISLIKKYKAVHELYSSLKQESGKSNVQCITQFTKLVNDKERQTTIAQHRDNIGIRFLNIVFSLFTFGIKNLITYHATEGYCGFWNSRGANLNQDLATQLGSHPK